MINLKGNCPNVSDGRYHAEGDVPSEFVKAEYTQIEQTLALEKETAKVSWASLLATRGNRRRVLIASFLGLATQWSRNGCESIYRTQKKASDILTVFFGSQ
jgi:hypothetical protein